MRIRWMVAGLVGASALALGTAASLAQKPGAPPRILTASPDQPKRWRSPALAQIQHGGNSLPEVRPEPPGPVPIEAAPVAAPDPGDPMNAVESFLQRNRREADDSIKALTQEAEALRARLARVEAALGRWQAVSAALNVEPKPPQPAAVEKAMEPGEVRPAAGPPDPALPIPVEPAPAPVEIPQIPAPVEVPQPPPPAPAPAPVERPQPK
jgi:hypothetical protein